MRLDSSVPLFCYKAQHCILKMVHASFLSKSNYRLYKQNIAQKVKIV